jgi:hypothetical protein
MNPTKTVSPLWTSLKASSLQEPLLVVVVDEAVVVARRRQLAVLEVAVVLEAAGSRKGTSLQNCVS